MKRGGRVLAAALALAATAAGVAASPAAAPAWVDRMHAEGVEWFRAARFPAAYGRFVALADLGHEASARHALWMCQNGLELFGRDWDCTGEQLQDWSRLAGVPTPPLQARHYGRTVVDGSRGAPAASQPGKIRPR